jgi:hypothetical protein
MLVLSTALMHLVALFCHCPLLHASSVLLLAQVCQYLYLCTSKASKVSNLLQKLGTSLRRAFAFVQLIEH